MRKKKEFNIQAINYLLYNARKEKHLSLKDASKSLGIGRLHLSLIEKGYLHVGKKLQPRFIKLYKLDKTFFEKNTTYVKPIKIKYDDPKIEEKLRKEMHKKRNMIISGIISLLMLGTIGIGVYFFTRVSFAPRKAWSNDFITFHHDIEKNNDGTKPSIDFPGDIAYLLEKETNKAKYSIELPAEDDHASGLVIYRTANEFVELTDNKVDAIIFAYNQKKVVMFDCVPAGSDDTKVYATVVYQKENEFSLNKITIATGSEQHDYSPDTSQYKEWHNNFFNNTNGYFWEIKTDLSERISQCSSEYTFTSLMDDMQVISTYKVFGFRLGIQLMLVPSIIFILSSAIFIVTIVKSRKRNPKENKVKPNVVYEIKHTANVELVYRSKPNDTLFPTIIPEFVLRALALIVLLLASVGTVWVTESIFSGEKIDTAMKFNNFISNIFVAGTTLAFFLKLEVYQKKTYAELIKNILVLFVIGSMFYVSECLIYACLSSGGSIYSALVKMLANFIPGNIVWNLMLYSLVFLFLFTLPDKFKNAPHKVLIWRLCSVIPTLLMLLAFIFQGTFRGAIPQYVSFIFYTNGALMTAFAIFYLYSLFFLQQYVRLKYGEEFEKIYIDSRRYAVAKNVLASVIIAFLVGIDILFYFFAPVNGVNLGNNWAIALLIPFILFYHPHIGKRTPKWDIAYIVMYGLFLVGGFIISLGIITNALDFSELAVILK